MEMKHDENGLFMKMINDSGSTAEITLPTAFMNVFLLSTAYCALTFERRKFCQSIDRKYPHLSVIKIPKLLLITYLVNSNYGANSS